MRASPRLAKVADQHVLEKAKKQAAWRNLDTPGNDLSPHSFSDHVISSKVCNLGVGLGSNPKQLSNLVALLKKCNMLQLDVQSVCPVDVLESSNSQMEEDDYDFENLTLGYLCGDFTKEVLDEDSNHLSCDFQTVFK